MKTISFLFLTLLLFCTGNIFAKTEKPAIIWASSPVKPDETVIIQTGEEVGNVTVELARLDDDSPGIPSNSKLKIKSWTKVEVLQRGVTTLKCLVPADWKPGIYACRINDKGEHSNPVLLNAPNVWWCQGDQGETSTPGGWLRLVGKCLDNTEGQNNKQALVYLRGNQGQLFRLPLQKADAFDLQVQIPLQTIPGTYEAWVHNGAGGEATWTSGGKISITNAEVWPSEVFNVKELGLETALQKSKANGGGIVYFPAGEYHVEDFIEIPDRTVLRGERTDLTSIYWLDLDSVPKTLIHGQYFAIEDLSLYCQNMYHNFIWVDDGEFRMERVRIRSNHMYMLGRTEHETPFRGRQLNGKVDKIDATIRLDKVKSFKITNCDILAGSTGFKLWNSSYGIIRDNQVQYGRRAFTCECSNQLIIENNNFEGHDMAATANDVATFFGNSQEHVMFKKNRFANAYGLDRELLTFDAAGGAYLGKMEKMSGTLLTLATDPVFRRYAPNATEWRNTAVCIMDGKGAGQYRRVVSHEGREWELDKPWLVEPDETSYLSIIPFRGRTLILNNTFEDGGAVQLYGMSIENMIAGNKGTRMSGFLNWGKESKGWGWQPSWYNMFLENEITEGNNYSHKPVTMGVLGTVSTNHEMYNGPLNNCVVLRENTIQSNGLFRIAGLSSDIVVEKNTVKYSKTGILIGKQPWDILLRHNKFEKVENHYTGEGVDKASIIIKKETKSLKN